MEFNGGSSRNKNGLKEGSSVGINALETAITFAPVFTAAGLERPSPPSAQPPIAVFAALYQRFFGIHRPIGRDGLDGLHVFIGFYRARLRRRIIRGNSDHDTLCATRLQSPMNLLLSGYPNLPQHYCSKWIYCGAPTVGAPTVKTTFLNPTPRNVWAALGWTALGWAAFQDENLLAIAAANRKT